MEVDGVAEDGDVVIGGQQGDQAEHEAADGLKDSEPVDAEAEKTRGPPAGLGGWG
jgi:hypothetical protein